MKKFGIIRNTGNALTYSYADQIRNYLIRSGCSCQISASGEDLEKETECAIVLGGDGTLLRAAKVVLPEQIPVIGINLGNLGYMAEIDIRNIYPALERLISDDFTIEKRMMLRGKIYRKDQVVFSDVALNDIVLKGLTQMRTYVFKTYVNGAYLADYHADGIIVSTPTGSTGYSLSAGGPIVSPGAEILMMTPLASHSMISRSIVFSGSDEISIEIGEGRAGAIDDAAEGRFDGAGTMKMSTGDVIKIRKSSKCTNFIKINNISFLEVLRRKMADQ